MPRQQTSREHVLVVIVTVLLGLWVSTSCAQNAPTSSSPGTDIVFIIDHSGSMSGCSVHPAANDPSCLRADLLWDLVVRLHGGAAQAYAMGDPRSYRIAVVEFGDSARVQPFGWFEVKYDPNDLRSEADQLAELEARYTSRVNCLTNFGYTNHLDAMQKTEKLFELINWGRGGAEPRALAAVLITDGQSYVEQPPYYSNGRFDLHGYQSVLGKNLEGFLDSLRLYAVPKPTFVVIGMSDLYKGSAEWDQTKDFWKKYATDIYTIYSADSLQLYRTLDSLTNTIRDVKAFLVRDTLEIPCYVGRLRITVYHRGNMAGFGLRDPSGNLVPLKSHTTATGSRFKVLEFTRPASGVWRVEGGGASVQVYAELYYKKVSLVEPSQQTVPMLPVGFEWEVSSVNDTPFVAAAGCPLEVFCRVEQGGLQIDSIDMMADPATPGLFVANSQWTPPSAGRYAVQLSGYTRTPNGTPFEIFASGRKTLIVEERRPLGGLILSPHSVFRFRGHATAPLEIRMISLIPDSSAPSLADLTNWPDSLIYYSVLGAEGDTLAQRKFLNPRQSSVPAEFSSSIDVTFAQGLLGWLGLDYFSSEELLLSFGVRSQLLSSDYGVYGFGDPPQQDFVYRVSSRNPLAVSLIGGAIVLWLLANLLWLLFDFAIWGLVILGDFLGGLRRVRVYYVRRVSDLRGHRTMKWRSRMLLGKRHWNWVDRILFLRSFVQTRLLRSAAAVPFSKLRDHERFEVRGLSLWRWPFSSTVKVKMLVADRPLDDAADVGRATKQLSKVAQQINHTAWELNPDRQTSLRNDLGYMGIEQ